MLLIGKTWRIASPECVDESVDVASFLLTNRGIESEEEKKEFLSPNPLAWHDPFLFEQMKQAVDLIVDAIANKKKILIYGDYDADGVAATSIFVRYFRSHNCYVSYLVPRRTEHGYGLTDYIIDDVLEAKPYLLITVDCGISNADTIERIKQAGIKVIVTDHHTVRSTVPQADAVICAKVDDCKYPFLELCGAGVALKTVEALGKDGRYKVYPEVWKQAMELAGIATIADLVPMINENRTIAKKALQSMANPSNLGVRVMNEMLMTRDDKPDETYISFCLVPRINAAGRLYDSSDAMKLFLSDDEKEVILAAKALNEQNEERKQIEAKVYDEAIEQVESNNRPLKWQITNTQGPVVVYSQNWHPGVLGIVAGKLAAHFSRSTIVFAQDPMNHENVRGSGRAFGEFDLFDAVEKVSELCESFGGHKKAAGLVVSKKNLPKFMELLESKCVEESSKDDDTCKLVDNDAIDVDMVIPFAKISNETLEAVKSIGPYGIANAKPTFVTRSVIVSSTHLMSEGQHLRLEVFDGASNDDEVVKSSIVSVVGFGMGEFAHVISPGDVVDIAYTMAEYTYRGITSLSLHLRDIKPCNREGLVWIKPEVPEQLYSNKLDIKQISKLLKAGNEKELLIPDEKHFSACYRTIKENFGQGVSTVDCDLLARYIYSFSHIEITPFQTRRCLDVFSEAGLIRLGVISSVRVCFNLLFPDGKAKLKLTDTYKRLCGNG